MGRRRTVGRATSSDTEVRKRFAPGDESSADREWTALTVLAEHAPGVAPLPIAHETDADGSVIVMTRLPGVVLGGEPLDTERTTALGRTLRRVWDVPPDAVRAAGLSERRRGPSALVPTLDAWLREAGSASGPEVSAPVRSALESARRLLADPEAVPPTGSTIFGIADLNPANVLWDGRDCRLVDFEDAGLSDPAFELADHVEHLAARLPNVYDPERLADAVGLPDEERGRMRAWRPLWATFWLLLLLPGGAAHDRNPPGTAELQARHLRRLLDGARDVT